MFLSLSKRNLIPRFQIGQRVFEILLLKDSSYFIVFGNNFDKVNEENWQTVLMNIFYFADILLYLLDSCIFILHNFALKLGQSVPSVPKSSC